MKKNGFTLVELLAIIAVLTAIMLLVLPKFSSSVNDRKQKEYNKLIKTIENAGKVYHTYNQGKNKVSINELVKEDLLTSGIKSPIDDTLISGCVFFGKDEKGEDLPKTVISREYSSEWKKGDEPYYPVNDTKNNTLYEKYKKLADKEEKVIFGGRLGEYRYYDMDAVIAGSLKLCRKIFGEN